MKRAGIGIPYPTQTSPTNFYMLDQCCEVLTASLLNGEALDIRTYNTQVREGNEAGQERRLDRDEGGVKSLQETIDKKTKNNLEPAC